MLIQVLTPLKASAKEKGDLLESLAAEFLKTQNYNVVKEVRVTASELDLLCQHTINFRDVYVECKAHKDNLSSNVLTNLLGTITFNGYSEGWLITTGPLGKDAKGFMAEWEKKGLKEREKLSIYTPERIIDALINAKIIIHEPTSAIMELVNNPQLSLGEWTLLISSWGKHWAAPVLKEGIPKALILFNAENGILISDETLYEHLKETEFEQKDLAIYKPEEISAKAIDQASLDAVVVEVEFGEIWSDYRPARPEHFVGRKKAQRGILSFFSDVKKGKTESRIFAIKGDSGIGKSSLISKMRDVAASSQKPNKLFLYAVDMRAANDSSYIHAALIKALNLAAKSGFGNKIKLEITNYNDPL